MNTVLFLGTKIGYETLKTLVGNEAVISRVYVDSEHAHEIERYADRIADLCDENKITVFRDVRLKDLTLELMEEKIDLLIKGMKESGGNIHNHLYFLMVVTRLLWSQRWD